MMIQDSGKRREYESGAVRDIQEGKGRCDLMPLDVVGMIFQRTAAFNAEEREILYNIQRYIDDNDVCWLCDAIISFLNVSDFNGYVDMILETSKHFEEGAKKYGEDNWKKGIPESSYIDSAVRHYLKWLRGDDDERHDRAFVWNIMCLIWTHEHITTNPEMPERSVFRDMTIRCVETDCYYNNDCICTAPPIFAVNGTAGKECFNYRED